MMSIAIIPARGGTKRIPRKNIRPFCGKPILAYSIQSALNSGLFEEVMISTDDSEIAEIAQSYGASVPFLRSHKNANDYATTADVILEVIQAYAGQGRSFSNLCCLYPTAPFVTSDQLKQAYALLIESDAESVVPIVPFSYPPLRGLAVEDGLVKMKWPEHLSSRSQDLEPIFHDSGQFYLTQTSAFLTQKTLFCKNTVPIILKEIEVQDIDTETDWKLAELKYKLIHNFD